MSVPVPVLVPGRWVGIDVSKAHLDVALLPEATTFRVPNDDAGWTTLVARITGEALPTVVLEATGSDHVGVTLALAEAGMPPAVMNPEQTHAFIRSEGQRTKTDRTDARLLARFVQQKQPSPRPVLTQNARDLKELVACRDDFTKLLTMEQNRLHVATERTRIVRSLPGIGVVLGPVFLAGLGELGQDDAKGLASLAGVAPHTQQSGTRKERGAIRGGRVTIRKALYQMAVTAVTRNPVMKAHFQQLLLRMPYKVAIIACARRMLGILNAMMRDGLTWQETKVGQGHFLPREA